MLVLVWMLLVNCWVVGLLVFVIMIGVVLLWLIVFYWLNIVCIKVLYCIFGYLVIVLVDIVKVNFVVVWIVLFMLCSDLKFVWVIVLLDLC